MAKRARPPAINVGQCVVMRPGQMMSYARSVGKVVAKERHLLHVKYHGETRPKILDEAIFTTTACPAWLAGSHRRKRSRR